MVELSSRERFLWHLEVMSRGVWLLERIFAVFEREPAPA